MAVVERSSRRSRSGSSVNYLSRSCPSTSASFVEGCVYLKTQPIEPLFIVSSSYSKNIIRILPSGGIPILAEVSRLT